jgi:thioredoxin reductase (NADPH)
VRVQDTFPLVKLADGTEIGCHALLIATGVSYRKLDIPGAGRLAGAGVYYGAAISEALVNLDKDVFIVGGGNSAGQAAMYLARYARSVTILVRGDALADTMSHYLIEQIEATPNIKVRTHTRVLELHGDVHLEALTLADAATGERSTVPAAALFIFIGALRGPIGWPAWSNATSGATSSPGAMCCVRGARRAAGTCAASRSGWRPTFPASS